jgi:hypothetical protein
MTTDLYAMGMRARNAIYSCFFLLGFLGLAWIPRIPEIKDSLNLSDGQFGLVLLLVLFLVRRLQDEQCTRIHQSWSFEYLVSCCQLVCL